MCQWNYANKHLKKIWVKQKAVVFLLSVTEKKTPMSRQTPESPWLTSVISILLIPLGDEQREQQNNLHFFLQTELWHLCHFRTESSDQWNLNGIPSLPACVWFQQRTSARESSPPCPLRIFYSNPPLLRTHAGRISPFQPRLFNNL
jgi:hypothetical protein